MCRVLTNFDSTYSRCGPTVSHSRWLDDPPAVDTLRGKMFLVKTPGCVYPLFKQGGTVRFLFFYAPPLLLLTRPTTKGWLFSPAFFYYPPNTTLLWSLISPRGLLFLSPSSFNPGPLITQSCPLWVFIIKSALSGEPPLNSNLCVESKIPYNSFC